MKIRTDPRVVYERIGTASRESGEETLALIQRKLRALPQATGTLASTYSLDVRSVNDEGVEMAIGSGSVYALPIERGAWVQGRGPHISGSGKGRHLLRDTARRDWPRRIAARLRA